MKPDVKHVHNDFTVSGGTWFYILPGAMMFAEYMGFNVRSDMYGAWTVVYHEACTVVYTI